MSTSAPAAPAGSGSQAPPAPATQPSSTGGQGQGAPGGNSATPDGGFNWGLFPGVPEGQRELLQPHLTNVLGHVTRLEQQYAPYKGLTEAVAPDQVENLMAFLQNYSQDPRATWLGLAQSLQEDGLITNPEFSIDNITQMLDAPQQPVAGQEDMPPWAQQMQQQLSQYEAQEQQRQQQAQAQAAQEEARQQETMLAEAHSTMTAQLKQAGVPEGLVTPEQLTAALIVTKGDIPQAVAQFNSLREGFLKGFVETNGNGPKSPTVNGGVPQVPKGGLRPRGGDPFRQASVGAQQMLAANARGQE